MSEPPLSTYTVYWSPPDFPGRYVVREWHIAPGGPTPVPEHVLFDSLGAARTAIQIAHPGAICLTRSPEDDLQIVETWL